MQIDEAMYVEISLIKVSVVSVADLSNKLLEMGKLAK